MGFWNAVGSATKAVGSAALEKSQEMSSLKNEYEYLSDSDLEHKARSGNSTQKMVAKAILKKR